MKYSNNPMVVALTKHLATLTDDDFTRTLIKIKVLDEDGQVTPEYKPMFDAGKLEAERRSLREKASAPYAQ
ncbi:MAG: hypothetical protein JJU05_19255 [Verrucomicrobia bacterium]|nr:hypothetical protein [Verrucomicrobiota bacterium]